MNFINKDEKREIFYNLINAVLAGGLVFAGSAIDGEITLRGVFAAGFTGLIVVINKFKNYWERKKERFSTNLFNFIG